MKRYIFFAVGEYTVLASAFPTYSGPKFVNSTSSHPVPSKSIPSPAKQPNPAYGCVQFIAKTIEGVGPSIVPGGLYIDPSTQNYVCNSVFASRVTVSTSIFSQGTAGYYTVPTGSAC